MKRTILIVALLAFAAPASAEIVCNPIHDDHADCKWSTLDTSLQLTFTTVTVVDWAQTRTFLRDPHARESNPLLGARPSSAKLNGLVAAALISHAIVARTLPRGFRNVWQVMWIVVEAEAVHHNYQLGVRVSF